MASSRESKITGDTTKRILLLGAGMVSDPVAKYFASKPDVAVTVATESPSDGQRLMSIGDNINSVVIDINREYQQLDDLIR
ncbi:unnamed protein product [Anisakis simplex]|uniref:Alpha-aminoadipic semialdehyde synthase, mitochondrial (inferred by orthology to a human protein) n=1 Tax=Anisakis simplex TaxID=6269 RepID=A0A0M3JFL3_ANISI|nr:unnamed protein product [Anisakis simplex]